jgi:hypothetical protein
MAYLKKLYSRTGIKMFYNIEIESVYLNKTIKIEIPKESKTIGILLSGGADSAILLYILCDYIKKNNLDIKVLPITSCVIAKPIMIEGTFRVTNKVRELFNYDIPFLLDNFLYYRGRKVFEFDINVYVKLFQEGVIDCLMGAGTTFASEEELKRHNMWDDRPEYRALDFVPSEYENLIPGNEKYKIYKPFLRYDKKLIAELYDMFNVRDTLFPATKSCIAGFSESRGWSTPCKRCWWCKERFWAFGQYDSERRTYLENIANKVYSWDPPLPPDNSNEAMLKWRLDNIKQNTK